MPDAKSDMSNILDNDKANIQKVTPNSKKQSSNTDDYLDLKSESCRLDESNKQEFYYDSNTDSDLSDESNKRIRRKKLRKKANFPVVNVGDTIKFYRVYKTMGNTFTGPTKVVITDIDPDDKFSLKLNSGLDLLRKDDPIKVDGQWQMIEQCKLIKCGSTEKTQKECKN